jgi:hypothetical protein
VKIHHDITVVFWHFVLGYIYETIFSSYNLSKLIEDYKNLRSN